MAVEFARCGGAKASLLLASACAKTWFAINIPSRMSKLSQVFWSNRHLPERQAAGFPPVFQIRPKYSQISAQEKRERCSFLHICRKWMEQVLRLYLIYPPSTLAQNAAANLPRWLICVGPARISLFLSGQVYEGGSCRHSNREILWRLCRTADGRDVFLAATCDSSFRACLRSIK